MLVGAGPGDPGLLTIKGKQCLEGAEVVVYDRLGTKSLLQYCNPDAEIIYAGKSPGKHPFPQEKINQLLIEKAQSGKLVIRLKGGDPFVFGRGGEEVEALAKAGIPYEIVPGVTSAIAVPAYAGIPLTHRDYASSFAVITGHEPEGHKSLADKWRAIAPAADTLVFVMCMTNLREIISNLIAGGRNPATPVAVIAAGTQPQQVTVAGTLSNIVDKVNEAGLTHPAITVVGDIVALRDKLRWFD
ncbi:MAG TPA: uroporphyrinogen-III C-methyltransferase [Nitrospirota bacterium]